MSRRWICCQVGAREHYSVPRALHQDGRLTVLYTDFWAGPILRTLAGRFASRAARSLAARFHPGLATALIESRNVRSVLWQVKLRPQSNHGARFRAYIEAGRRFACAVRDSLRRRTDLTEDTVLFSYDTAALEAMEWCRERGLQCVLDQMDPSRVEVELVREEEKRWPGWSTSPEAVPEEYFRRREQEWGLAARVMVNSEFCRQALVRQGVPAEKTMVVPLCYEPEIRSRKPEVRGRWSAARPLRVLFLGQVILRKGIQYLIEAARRLEHENIRFDVVGPIGISQEAVVAVPRNVFFHGRSARNEASRWYREADAFVLPTLSDGFGITQLEAMSHGLPVVATPCCGAVVSDGIDGFMVPPRDADALVRTFQRYLAEPALLWHQQTAAVAKSKQFALGRLAANLLSLEATLAG